MGHSSSAAPLVSVVMPVWRPKVEWLLQAVESVLAERGCELELVVVDDGNEQAVTQLLASVDDPRLRVVRIPHGGVSAARNAGVAEARGAYVRLVDCDDYHPPGGTAALLALAGGRQDVIAYGQTQRCDAELRPTSLMSCSTRGGAELECFLGGFPVRHMSLLFPRAVVEATGEWDAVYDACEDWDYVLRALEHAEVVGTDLVVTWYRNHPDSASTDLAACEAGMRRVVARHLERHPELHGTALARRAEAQVALKLFEAHLERGAHGRGVRLLRDAAVRDPSAAARSTLHHAPRLARRATRRLARSVWPR